MGKITPFWAIPIKYWDQEFVNLTGSATIYEVWWKKILIDLGLFQWTEWSDIFNKENIDFIKNIDIVIITHAHIDHLWRLPLLHKLWYEWDVYMTNPTKDIAMEMLLDSLKIQEEEAIERESKNKNLWNRLREALKILKSFKDIRKNNLEADEKNRIVSYLNSKLWNNYNQHTITQELNWYLNFYWVREESDIELVIKKLKETLFSKEDVIQILGKVKTIDLDEEKILSSREIKVENSNHKNWEILEQLPEKVAKWYNTIIQINSKNGKTDLKRKWEEQLKQEIRKVRISGKNINQYRGIFKKEYQKYLAYITQYSFYEEDAKHSSAQLNKLQLENRTEYEEVRKTLKEYAKKLNNLNIKTYDDIERISNNDELLIETQKIDLKFNSIDIENALKLLEVKKENNPREIIGITAVDAAHVIWAVSIQIISWVIKKQIKSLTDMKGEWFCVHFSWDLWRMKDNRLGKPQIPLHPVDYLQIESTYGWRNHRNRQESEKDLMDSIEESVWDVLIAVFSQQRKQEILMTILENFIHKWAKIHDYEILIDAPLASRLTEIYLKHSWETFNLLEEKVQIELFGKVVFRYLEEWEFESIYEKKLCKDHWENIIKLNLKHPDFSHLNEEEHKKIRSIIKEVKSNQHIIETYDPYFSAIKEIIWEDLFKKFIWKDKKRIILASSWMMDGWAIMNHLPYILTDRDSTLLAPGYLSEWTLWNDIIRKWKEVVTVNGIKLQVECNKKFIDGFSSHIWHDEILEYLQTSILAGKFKKDAIISFTHWNIRWQEELKSDMNQILKDLNRTDIKIIIPDFWDTILVWEKEIKKEKINFTKPVQKPLAPEYLKNNTSDSDEQRDKKTPEENTNIQLKTENQKIIFDLRVKVGKRIQDLEEKIDSHIFTYLHKNVFSKQKNVLWKIKNLSREQKKLFYWDIDNKLNKNRRILNDISNLNSNIKELNNICQELDNFIHIIAPWYKNEILELHNKNNDLRIQEKDIQEEITSSNFIDKEKTASLRNQWESINKKIVKNEESIQLINRKRENYKIDIKRKLNRILPQEMLTKILDQYDQLWKNTEAFQIFRELITLSQHKIKEEIITLKSEHNSYLEINFSKKDPNFQWRNLYEELIKNWEIDVHQLNMLLETSIFGWADKQYLENLLKENDKTKAFKNIKKFLKNKSHENNDLWIDTTIDTREIEIFFLQILKQIFNKEYYENYILVNFNIYLFLKSWESFENYVKIKYDLKQIKDYKNINHEFLSYVSDLEYYSTLIQKLENLNIQTEDSEKLSDINFWIESTRDEVNKVLQHITWQL